MFIGILRKNRGSLLSLIYCVVVGMSYKIYQTDFGSREIKMKSNKRDGKWKAKLTI